MKNINDTTSAGLCTGCGTCAGICPNSAIKMVVNSNGVYSPQIFNGKCVQCGICIDACPGHSFDFKGLSMGTFCTMTGNPLIGNYLNCYLGNSTNNDIRYHSTSGGLITQLLIFALENRIINGVLVTKMDETNPLRPRPFIARTVKEVIEASKSKYCPVPLNIMIREILRAKDDEKIAIVGLPCHIQGIRKAENINEQLKKKVILHFGLFCNHTPQFLATDFLLEQIGINKRDVKKLDYRGKGWPGGMSIILKDDSKIFIPYFSPLYWGVAFNLFFFPQRCTLCSDKLCELADLSFGDAWLPEIAHDNLGTSIVITRSKGSEDLLHNVLDSELIELKKVDADAAFRSQSIRSIKKRVKARRSLFTLFGEKVPSNNQELPDPNPFDYSIVIIFHFLNYVLSRRTLWKFTKLCSILIEPMRTRAKSFFSSL